MWNLLLKLIHNTPSVNMENSTLLLSVVMLVYIIFQKSQSPLVGPNDPVRVSAR